MRIKLIVFDTSIKSSGCSIHRFFWGVGLGITNLVGVVVAVFSVLELKSVVDVVVVVVVAYVDVRFSVGVVISELKSVVVVVVVVAIVVAVVVVDKTGVVKIPGEGAHIISDVVLDSTGVDNEDSACTAAKGPDDLRDIVWGVGIVTVSVDGASKPTNVT